MKTFYTFQKFIASCFVLCFSIQSFAIHQIDGNWEEYGLTSEYDGYYVIATADDLEEFRDMVNGGQSDINGVLTDDIVLNESVLDENGDLRSDYETAELKRWLPISYYSGTFDGRNHMISGLFVSGRGAYVGFFRKITGGVQIKNLNIVDSYFEGDNVIGGICADSEREGIITISNCSVNAYVYAKADQAGGIYGGYEYGGVTVENCVNLGKVISKGGNVGGICSISNGKIIGCINKGIVRGNGDRVGGILGGYGGTISNCCNMGIVEGSEYVGGIAGKGSRIINSCNLGTVNGVTNVGGIAGSAYTLENVYNVGDVTANAGVVGGLAGTITNVSYAYNAGKISNNSSLSNVGGLCGECTGTMTYCYYDSEVCPFSAVNNSTYAGATDKTTSAMCSSTLLTGLSSDVWAAGTTNVSASIIPNDEEFATKIIGQYPQLKFLNIESFTPYARKIYYNIGMSSMPEWEPCKLIYSIQDLVKIAVYPTATFVLMNDITEFRNLSDGSLLETPVAEWIPIGIFKGKLFGRGKTISGLCKTSTTGNGGLFEEVSSALIKDLNVANCRFDGDTVGGITGKASGETSIINCNNYCDFDVSSAKYVGGICGYINNYVAGKEPITINKCNNYGSIKGKTSYGGGICGYVYSQLDVIECVNYGNIVSSTSGGGIIGYGYARYLDAGIIQECVNNGVISSKYAGGIAGEINIFTSINYCLNNGLITGQGRVGGIVGTESSGNNMTQCLNVARVETNATAGGICANIGALFARYNYYNSDNCSHGAISDEDNGNCKGKTTAELISGELPYGFSSDYWGIRPVEIKDMKKYYYYPYLKCYGADSAILAVVRDCHSVSMNFNGGTTTDSIISFYVETEQALLPTNVQKTGCTFDGWYDNSNYTSSPYTEVPLTETQPKNFYAKWIANNYSVSLSPNGGNINMGNVQSYTYGYGAWLPQDVTKAGNTFKGWYPIKTCDVVLKSYLQSQKVATMQAIRNLTDYSLAEIQDIMANLPAVIATQVPISEAINYKTQLNSVSATVSFESAVLSDEEEKCDLYLESCGTHKIDVVKIIRKHLNLGLADAKTLADAAPTTLLSQVPIATAQAMKADLDTLDDVISSYQNFVGGSVVTTISSTDFGDKYFGAKWQPNTYTITYNTNGGLIETSPIESYTFGENVELPQNIIREGYTFEGWYNNSNLTGSEITEITSSDYGDKAFYAKWTVNSYHISLEPFGGKINKGDVTSYTYGTSTMLPQDVTRTGYTFKGWYPYQSCDIILESTTAKLATVQKLQDLYGLHVLIAQSLVDNPPSRLAENIDFDTALIQKSQLNDVGAEINLKSMVLSDDFAVCDLVLTSGGENKIDVIKKIKEFTGLGLKAAKDLVDAAPTTILTQVPVSTAQDLKDELDALGAVSSFANMKGGSFMVIYPTDLGDKYFGAKWDANTYSVNLQVNGGTNTRNVSDYTYGIGATLPADSEISREGYTFAGWYVNSNYDGVAVGEISTTDYGDKTFYAKWLVNSYDVTLEANDGTINSGILKSYIYGVGATLPTDVTKTGYTFKGWYDNPRFEGESVLAIPANATGNKTYYANWVVNTYSVTFFTYEGVMGTDIDSYTFGKETVLPTEVTKSGYDFGGWYTNDSYSGVAIQSIASNETGDKMYYAKWNKKSYPVTVTFDRAMGSISGIDSYLHGDNAVLKAHADAGYDFAFWSCDDESVLADKNVRDSTLTFVVTSPTELSATFKFKEIVYPAAEFVIGTIKTETEIAPIELATLFESSEGGEISYMVTSSSPNVLFPQIEDGKLYLSTMGLQGKATITVTAKLANGNKSSLSAEAVVEYNCNIHVVPTIVNASCYGFPDGSISLSAENEYTYQWIGEDVTINKIENVKAGNYSVQITDERGCKSLETYTVSQPDEISVKIAEVVNPRCGVQSEIHLNAAGDYTYAWSNGSTEKDLIGAEIGDYSVVVTNPETGCSITLTQSLELTFQKPQISLVTVSKETGKNLIVWVRENTDQIAYYTIYREGAQSKKYTAIGTVNYSEISVFQDDVAKPMTRQWSYKISATDVCGHETELSEAHTTLHLNEMESMHDGMAELIWQPYEGLDYNSFYIVRETKVNNYTFIDTVTTVPSTLTSYTAEIPPLGKSIFYVGVKLDKVIDPKQFMKAESGPFALALSNIAEAENMGNPDAVETMENAVEVSVISHTIFVKNVANKTIDVYGINGCKIISVNGLEINAIDVPHDGVYFVVVGGKATKVLVK